MKKHQLKTYIWEDVLRDYTSGMIVIVAYGLDDLAIQISKSNLPEYVKSEMRFDNCRILKHGESAYVYGGG